MPAPTDSHDQQHRLSRRDWVARSVAVAGLGFAAGSTAAEPPQHEQQPAPATSDPSEPFGYCLNTSTISGQGLDVVQMIGIAAAAGYRAVEPWVGDLDKYAAAGGSLRDLGKRIADHGLTVPSAIGFPEWIVDDDARRARGLEVLRKNMDVVRQIGGTRLAAPPAGATNQTDLNLFRAADRYREILRIGDAIGVVPQLELWGFSRSLSRLGEVGFVAIEAGHPRACVLADVYHIYKGGSPIEGLQLFNGSGMHALHCNDYPAVPPRGSITDAARVYPGDGVAPLPQILRTLRLIGYRGVLSLELFNREYWKQDPKVVAKTGLEKMRAAVKASFAGPG